MGEGAGECRGAFVAHGQADGGNRLIGVAQQQRRPFDADAALVFPDGLTREGAKHAVEMKG
jgi:hypothetical protein